jgi:hypothetical protein
MLNVNEVIEDIKPYKARVDNLSSPNMEMVGFGGERLEMSELELLQKMEEMNR